MSNNSLHSKSFIWKNEDTFGESVIRKIWSFGKNEPIPLFALLGLLVGVGFYVGEHPDWSQWVWAATLIVGGIPIVFQTVKGMMKGEFASDIVAMLAIVTAIIMGQFFAGAVVVLMQSGGEALERYGFRKASSSLKALLERAPSVAFRKKGEGLEKIDVKDVRVGDILIVRPGDLVPVDGTIVEGNAEIDESALTGEPLAKNKAAGNQVFSGSIDLNGAIEMRADKVSQESQYAKIVELVKKAQLEKAPIQRLADRYAVVFTPLTLIMSGLGFLITRDPTTILSVLVVATPCPLILATPLAIICGINKSAKSGIIVKGGAAMEQVGLAKAVIFDKTGTITFGTPYVEEIIPLNNETVEDLLYSTASLEQFSSHSIAKAVVDQAKGGLALPLNFQESPGRGVAGDLEGCHYTVGSYAFLEKELGKDCFKNCQEAIERFYNQNKLLIFIAKDALCVGILVISDRIRPGIKELIQRIRALGVQEVVMLTGDSAKNGEVIAREAGIKEVKAELLPGQKADVIKELLGKYNPIVMVGDGINDAPALATATVGIAMGAYGSAISVEAADIVLLVDDLGKVGDAIAISQRTIFVAKESILAGIGLSFVLMIVASFGFIQPAIGAMLQEVIDVVVILNALRIR